MSFLQGTYTYADEVQQRLETDVQVEITLCSSGVTPCILVGILQSGRGRSGRREVDADVSKEDSASMFSVEIFGDRRFGRIFCTVFNVGFGLATCLYNPTDSSHISTLKIGSSCYSETPVFA